MIGRALAVGAAAWVGWAWLPHLLTPACAWRGPRGARRVALTFDDGPDPRWTPRVLDALGAAGVRGTFFLVGERCVFWSIQPEGQRPASAERQVAHVLRRAHPGAIVDLHDAEGTPAAPQRLLQALPALLDGLCERGYAFTTVADLLSASR